MKKLLLLTVLLLSGQFVFAQQSAREILKKHVERQLEEIINNSGSVTGMMAVDLLTGDSFAVNKDIVFAQASAIKIPILMEVFKQAYQKKFALTDLKPLLPGNIVGGSGILNAMTDPVSLSIRNYCMLMIGLSDNSATNTLIDLVGMKSINETMESLGFQHTRVQRKMIDQQASIRNEENISSPAEAIKILQLLHDGKFINKEVSDGVLAILARNPRENSKLAKGLPSNVNISFKPGGMGGVSTEWAIVHLDGKPYAVTVMDNYRSGSADERVFNNISKVLFGYYSTMAKATKYGVIL